MKKSKVLSWKYFNPNGLNTEVILFTVEHNNRTSSIDISRLITTFYGCNEMTADLANTFLNEENNKIISLYNSDFLGWYLEKYRIREPIVCNNSKDVLAIRHKICTGMNKTMLWSGAKKPLRFHNSDGSLWTWSARDIEEASLWAPDDQLEKMRAGETAIIDNYHGAEINALIARDNGKDTLNMMFDRVGISLPEYDSDDSNSVECWETASRIWAENASGEVGVSVGSAINRNSVFAAIELDLLKANDNVTSIVVYDNWPIAANGKPPKKYKREEFERMDSGEFILEQE